MVQRFVWSTSGRPRDGESCSGDGVLCAAIPINGRAFGWMAVMIDGLGHGPAAHEATGAVVGALETFSFARPDDVLRALRTCHEAARPTRGAVMAIAHIGPTGSVTWTGVGNVEGLVCRPTSGGYEVAEPLISRAGVVGYQLPQLMAREVTLSDGDVLVMHTDGVATGWVRQVGPIAREDMAAAAMDRRFADGSDDACVLVGWLEAEHHA